MRKYMPFLIVFAIGFGLFFLGSSNESNNNSLDYTRITDVDYKAVVVDEAGGRGKILVTERISFDVHAASQNNLYWELWRDLSEERIDGVDVKYKVISVKQIMEDGSSVVYQESPRLYWEDEDFVNSPSNQLGPGKWYHSEGPYDEHWQRYECVFFYVDGLYRETAVFEISYEMSNAILRYGDCSELYITPYSESEIKYLNSFQGQILVPDEIMPRPENYTAHTYGTNTNSFPFTESDSINPGYHTFLFELDKTQLHFKPYNEYIEFSLLTYGEDKHIFTKHASQNSYYDSDVLNETMKEQAHYDALPKTFKIYKLSALVIFSVITILVLISTPRFLKKIQKKHHFYNPTETIDYYTDIPSQLDPYFASALVFCKDGTENEKQHGLAAVLLSLVHKNYIALEKIDKFIDWIPENVLIMVKQKQIKDIQDSEPQDLDSHELEPQDLDAQNPELQPLTQTEQLYFDLILRHTTTPSTSLKTFEHRVEQDYQNTRAFLRSTESSIVNIGVSQGYFQKADYKQPANQIKDSAFMLNFIGLLFLILGNILSSQTRLDLAFGAFFILGSGLLISAFYRNKVYKQYILLTQFGEDEYAKWRGLYHFLNSNSFQNDSALIPPHLGEQYLIYATAFGIAEKVNDVLAIRCFSTSMNPILYHPYYRSNRFRSNSRSFNQSARRTSTSRSSGFGGHGGYGGGGRGGGGGGGGH